MTPFSTRPHVHSVPNPRGDGEVGGLYGVRVDGFSVSNSCRHSPRWSSKTPNYSATVCGTLTYIRFDAFSTMYMWTPPVSYRLEIGSKGVCRGDGVVEPDFSGRSG